VLQQVGKELVRPVTLVGHSMGGNLATRYTHDHPGEVDRLVLVTPMFGVSSSTTMNAVADGVSHVFNGLGFGEIYGPGQAGYGERVDKVGLRNSTSDGEHLRRLSRIRREEPEQAIGGWTMGWMAAATDSMQIVSDPGYLEGLKTKTLLITAGSDQVVLNEAEDQAAARLPDVEQHVIAESKHGPHYETRAIRRSFWDKVLGFVASVDPEAKPGK
jgi:lysophospholipase